MKTSDKHNDLHPGCALGRQMTVEFYDCDAGILTDSGRMEEIFVSSAKRSGATVISSHFHSFMPQGVSGVVVISESHFAVHAWPEHEYAAVDLFTCGEGVDFDCAVQCIASGLKSDQWVISSLISRGIVGNNGVERLVPVMEGRDHHSFQLSWKSRFEKTDANAFSVAIDLYGAGENAHTDADIRRYTSELASCLNLSCHGECRVYLENDMLRFEQPLCGGWINGICNLEKGTVYIDIFNETFFDPRTAAEQALKSFNCSYYRMQPHVRQ